MAKGERKEQVISAIEDDSFYESCFDDKEIEVLKKLTVADLFVMKSAFKKAFQAGFKAGSK